MKRLFILCLIGILCSGVSLYAQENKKELTKEERKEAQRALDMRLFEEAKSAIEEKSFVMEADRIVFKRGRSVYVSSSTNFVSVNGDDATVQVAFNSVYSGPNGLGGITVDGKLSKYTIKYDNKGNIMLSMNVTGTGISAQIFIKMMKDSNSATVDINPNFNSNRITLHGNIIPLEYSRIFKGRSI